jgi:general stress protein YciG
MIEGNSETTRPRAKRGFAVMDPTRVREIASMGGRTAHANGRAHEFTSEEARAAGKKRHQRTPSAEASAT